MVGGAAYGAAGLLCRHDRLFSAYHHGAAAFVAKDYDRRFCGVLAAGRAVGFAAQNFASCQRLEAVACAGIYCLCFCNCSCLDGDCVSATRLAAGDFLDFCGRSGGFAWRGVDYEISQVVAAATERRTASAGPAAGEYPRWGC